MRNRLLAILVFVTAAFAAQAQVNTWSDPLDTAFAVVVAVHPTNPSIVYVGGQQDDIGRIRKSTNAGASWDTVFSGPIPHTILIDPQSPSTVYMAASGEVGFGGAVYKSTDGGANWSLRNLGLVDPVETLAIDPLAPSTLYAATFGGDIYKTVNGGDTWLLMIAHGGTVRALAVDPAIPGRVYAGISGGVLRSFDGGSSWSAVLFASGTVELLFIDPGMPTTIYASDAFSSSAPRLYRSDDSGFTWTPVTNLHSVNGLLQVQAMAAIPGSPSTLFVSELCGVWRSLDGGASWAAANANLRFLNPDTGCFHAPSHLANSPAAPNTLFGVVTFVTDGPRRFVHDASLLTPTCSLSASPERVETGGSSTLTAYCSPAATSYIWSANTGFTSTTTTGSVFPTQTTVYTVQGVNANGAGNVASVTVTAPSPRLASLSTRGPVLTGDNVLIAGFIIGGSTAKTVVVNVAGPSLSQFGVQNPLADPRVTLVRNGQILASNDNWQSADNSAGIVASGFAPNHPSEPAILMTLQPGAYTAIVEGVGGATGIGLVGVFEVDNPNAPMINISTRGRVGTGDDVLIAGFIIQGTDSQRIVVNVAGPSLSRFGIANPIANPTLTLVRSSDQVVIAENDNWLDSPDAAQIQALGFAPNNQLEPAILATLPPGAYTAVVRGAGGGTGVGLVGFFAVVP